MSKKVSAIILVVVFALAIGLTIANLFRPTEVQTGRITKCLDPKHQGNPMMHSSIKALWVARKDASKYGVTVDSSTCTKCQARVKVEEQEARANRKREEVFIAALRKHDDAVLLCCRHLAGSAQADPYGIQRSADRDIRRLRSLALSGKQLCAPQSLAQVEANYNKSMDELLASLPYIEKGLKNVDVDAMQEGKLHMVLSKKYRDEVISDIQNR